MTRDNVASQPLVSVIIPTYNSPTFLCEAIDSVLGQTYNSVEVIVVDDGSTDNTPEVMAKYGNKVKYIRQENTGTAGARNTGLQHATGEFIALLDHDDRWLPSKLERQVPVMMAHPDVALLYAGIRFFNTQDGSTTAEYFPGPTVDVHDLLAHQVLTVQTILIRSQAILEVGPFDADLLGTDDWDMSIRIAAHHALFGMPEILAEARVHGDNQSSNVERMFRNAMSVLEKHQSIHKNCKLCKKAIRTTRAILIEDYYAGLKKQARKALQEKQYGIAYICIIRAIKINPRAVRRVMQRQGQKLIQR